MLCRLDSQALKGLDGDRDDPDPLARGRLGPPGDRKIAVGSEAAVVALERPDRVYVAFRHAVRPCKHRPEGVREAHLYDIEALVRAAQVAPRSLFDDGHSRPAEDARRVMLEPLSHGLDDQRVRDDRRHGLRAIVQRSKYVEPAAGLDHERRGPVRQPVDERGRQVLGEFRAFGRDSAHRAQVVAVDRQRGLGWKAALVDEAESRGGVNAAALDHFYEGEGVPPAPCLRGPFVQQRLADGLVR